jgi:hypothetical protein
MPTLTVPLRLEVLKRMSACLGEIAIASGYKHDLAGRVYRGRGLFGDETPIPCLSILEAPIPLDQLPSAKDNPKQAGPWELVVQGWVKDDRQNPTDPAHVLLADVKKRLAIERKKTDWDQPEQGIFGLGQFVTALYIGPGVVRPPEEISSKAYFWLTITLDIAEDMEKPYEV